LANSQPRILFYDIETSLQLAAIFQLAHNDWISPESLVSERYVICAAWKWEGESKIHTSSVLDDPKRYKRDPHDDLHVVKTLHSVLSEADVIIAHNGDSFDKRYIDTRILVHGLSPLPPIASVDTYKVAKSKFYLNSNKLDYIGKLLKVGQKVKTTPGLWMRVLNGEAAAVKEMVDYNKQDVVLLEKVYNKLKPYAQPPNLELFGREGCPRCASKKIQARGIHRAITKEYQRWQCQDCGGWFRTLRGEQGSTEFRVV
jgi:hypothetical protein